MKKSEIKEIVNHCINQRSLCRVLFRYAIYYKYYFPLVSNDKLFLSAEEDDFIINGYTIRRYVDATKTQIIEDKYLEILKNEGIVNSLQTPNIDISNWEAVFTSLKRMNKNIIVEKESLKDEECQFVIGRIDKVYKNFAYIWNFDADGIWDNGPIKISYSEITNIIFGSRYVDIFSKYIDKPPFCK